MYLAVAPGRLVSALEISQAFSISAHHVRKVAKDLVRRGWVEGQRGAGGGLRLRIDPRSIRVGHVIRELEELTLLECFEPSTDACAISPRCRLKKALQRATSAFTRSLNDYTLADLVGNSRQLRHLLDVSK
jgi:Rrf2 family nitric oxide-sensitive transcriptional repressor